MNKTININLANTFFHINENAYAKLKAYLKTLEDGFKNTLGKEEILKDIEARIAELFQEVKTNSDYVISEADVDKIISVLGQPEDFITEEDEEEQTEESTRKKLFRDPDDKYIGGVASGLGHYFGIDNSWIRLIWLLLTVFSIGSLITVYLLLWILLPEAKTTVDKLKMKGEPVNISTIEKKIKKEFEEVSSRIKDIDYEKTTNSLKKKSRNFFQLLEKLLKVIPTVAFRILGFLFLITSISFIVAVFIALIFLLFFGTALWPLDLLGFDLIPNLLWVLTIVLFVLIPFLFLFSLGVRLLRGRSSTFGTVGRFVLFCLWLTAIISIFILAGSELRKHNIKATKTEKHHLQIQPKDTLYVDFFKNMNLDSEWKFEKNNPITKFVKRIGEERKYLSISIEKSDTLSSALKIRASAKGSNKKRAQNKAQAINYNWELNNKTLYLDRINPNFKLNNLIHEEIDLSLLLSEGQFIYLNNSLKSYLNYSTQNDQGFRSRKTTGYLWKMGSKELECLDCPTNQSKLQLQYQDDQGEEKLHLKVDEDGIKLKTK